VRGALLRGDFGIPQTRRALTFSPKINDIAHAIPPVIDALAVTLRSLIGSNCADTKACGRQNYFGVVKFYSHTRFRWLNLLF
jgi:hypothetical protein